MLCVHLKFLMDTICIKERQYGIEGNVGQNDSSDEEDLTAVTYYI